MLAPKNATSIDRKMPTIATIFRRVHRHRSRATTMNIADVIVIVEITAMPYAAARLDDDWKPITSRMHAIISIQLTAGI